MPQSAIPARYYQAMPDGVLCTLCPVACHLREGQTGRCKVRRNIDGTLCTLVYGQPCAAHVDPIEKKPLYHFLPASTSFSIGTAGCNLLCMNCQNWEISTRSPDQMNTLLMMPDDVVNQAHRFECASISYTYNDPTVFFEYAYDTALRARVKGLRNVMVSAGYINEAPLRDFCKVMDAANIDLKTFDDKVYHKLNGAHLDDVLRTLCILKENGVWLEITNLIVPQWTDNPDTIARMCHWLVDNGFIDVPLHFSRFFPNYKLNNLPPTPVDTLQKAYDIAVDAGLHYVYLGNVPNNEMGSTHCHHCGKVLIERHGYDVRAIRIQNGRCEFCSEPIPGVW
jgi:pyruvate formate lyase activating enzyme